MVRVEALNNLRDTPPDGLLLGPGSPSTIGRSIIILMGSVAEWALGEWLRGKN
jgi:hypothetical protein